MVPSHLVHRGSSGGRGILLYFAGSVLTTGRPAHYMTQPEFVKALRQLTEKSPYPELNLVRKDDFIKTFGN